jgi:hypothetical protein
MSAKSTKPPNDDMLREAAEMRASGAAWEAIGAKLHRAESSVRRWPQAYPDRWNRFAAEAEHAVVVEAVAESVHVLRNLLRSQDEKIRRDAARALAELRIDLLRHELDAGSEEIPARSSDTARLLAFLEGQPDDDLARLAVNVFPDAALAEPVSSEPGAAAGPA